MRYQVILSPQAEDRIWLQARYIAHESGSVDRATQWLDRLLRKIDTLEQWPRSCALAMENDQRPFEIRKLNFGDYLVLFTIDDARQVVEVIGFRHGRQRSDRGGPDRMDPPASKN